MKYVITLERTRTITERCIMSFRKNKLSIEKAGEICAQNIDIFGPEYFEKKWESVAEFNTLAQVVQTEMITG